MKTLRDIYPMFEIADVYRDLKFENLIFSNTREASLSSVRKVDGIYVNVGATPVDKGLDQWHWNAECDTCSGSVYGELTISAALDRIFYRLFCQVPFEKYVKVVSDSGNIDSHCWYPDSDLIRTNFGDLVFKYAGISCRRWDGTFGGNQVRLYEHQNVEAFSSTLVFIPTNQVFFNFFSFSERLYQGEPALLFLGPNRQGAIDRFATWVNDLRTIFWVLDDLKPSSEAQPWTKRLLEGL